MAGALEGFPQLGPQVLLVSLWQNMIFPNAKRKWQRSFFLTWPLQSRQHISIWLPRHFRSCFWTPALLTAAGGGAGERKGLSNVCHSPLGVGVSPQHQHKGQCLEVCTYLHSSASNFSPCQSWFTPGDLRRSIWHSGEHLIARLPSRCSHLKELSSATFRFPVLSCRACGSFGILRIPDCAIKH